MFRIAYGAGHYRETAGRRIPLALDANQTREWQLNDRVARYFAEKARQYQGVELLRVDDPAGIAKISVEIAAKQPMTGVRTFVLPSTTTPSGENPGWAVGSRFSPIRAVSWGGSTGMPFTMR